MMHARFTPTWPPCCATFLPGPGPPDEAVEIPLLRWRTLQAAGNCVNTSLLGTRKRPLGPQQSPPPTIHTCEVMMSFTPLCANTLLGPDCARLDHTRLQTPSLGLGLCVDVSTQLGSPQIAINSPALVGWTPKVPAKELQSDDWGPRCAGQLSGASQRPGHWGPNSSACALPRP